METKEINLDRVEYNGINSIYNLDALAVTNAVDDNGNVLKWAFYPKTNKLIIFNDYANAIITYIK